MSEKILIIWIMIAIGWFMYVTMSISISLAMIAHQQDVAWIKCVEVKTASTSAIDCKKEN